MSSHADAFDARADRWKPFGATIFAEMTRLATEHDAVNLSQGMPDEDGPSLIKDAAARAMREQHNQYAPTGGLPTLTEAISASAAPALGRAPDPDSEVTVTPGCTGALAASALGLLNPGDEVVLFEPFYDSYRACAAMAGATPRFVPLRASGPGEPFGFDPDDLRAAFMERTKAVIVNTPHNPTGKVFGEDELGAIADLCREHDTIAISDEVYERLVYEGEHRSIASLPGMADRTIVCSSLGKTFSLTGWKIGWAIATPHLTRAVRAAHQFLIFAVATPLQHAAAEALRSTQADAEVRSLAERYKKNRDFLDASLREMGFITHPSQAGYFIMAEHAPVSDRLGIKDDVDLCRRLTTEAGVAAIPPSSFYAGAERGAAFVRFAYCKRREVLEEAVRRLHAWIGRAS